MNIRTECRCGNSYGSHGSSEGCNLKCPVNTTELCGGFLSNSVYDVMLRKKILF